MQGRSIGMFNLEEFKIVLKNNGIYEAVSEKLFKLLDNGNVGQIDFREFVCFMAIISNGNLEDRLKLAFKSYDLD